MNENSVDNLLLSWINSLGSEPSITLCSFARTHWFYRLFIRKFSVQPIKNPLPKRMFQLTGYANKIIFVNSTIGWLVIWLLFYRLHVMQSLEFVNFSIYPQISLLLGSSKGGEGANKLKPIQKGTANNIVSTHSFTNHCLSCETFF